MSNLVSISSVTAEVLYTYTEIAEAAKIWLTGKDLEFELFQRFHRASGTESRSYVLPLPEILKLNGQGDRASLFFEYGLPLACQAVESALTKSEMNPGDIDGLIFTSCTCPLIPSLDTELLQRMGFSPSVKRVPMYQQGCAGGVVGLSLAHRLSSLGENILLVSVELCSLLFRLKESSNVHLLGSALFADGAAASIISNDRPGLKILGSQSHLIPKTGHLMGYDIKDDGAHLKLDRTLPDRLQVVLPGVVQSFLTSLELSKEDFPWWVIHPGGVKILDGIAKLLELKMEQCSWSYDVLSKIGNMSSATVQFVLSDCLNSTQVKPGEKIMMIGIGPGLTIELVAFEV